MRHQQHLWAVLVLLPGVLAGPVLGASPAGGASEDLSALKPFLRTSMAWTCPSLGRDFPLNVYFARESTGSEAREVILYVMNEAWERIGRESDLSILRDYIGQEFIVVTLDFGNAPQAVSPAIDGDIDVLYQALFGLQTPSILKAINLQPEARRLFVLPEGYRVATDLTFWEIDKHGAYGTLEYIMKTYNEEIVAKIRQRERNAPDLQPATQPSDMVDRQGRPFDYRIKMDIVYPSQATRRLPVFVESATQIPRVSHRGYLFQCRGYVYVVMGHCFNPIVQHYWHCGPFTLDHWNGLACYTAAMRYLYKNADLYSMDTDHIGMMGISKGQYAVTRLSDPNHAGTAESKKFSSFPAGFGTFPDGTPQAQPWQGYPSRIHCGWQGMGMGLWEREYITPDYVPTILACGENDRDVITDEGTPIFLKALEAMNTNHVYLFMEGLGHSFSYGYDNRLGVDRHRLVNDFFDRYLKSEDKLPPVVLIASPRDGAEGVSSSEAIWVQFAPVIDETTILSGRAVQVATLPDRQDVKGSWAVSHGGTKFTFTPDAPLAPGRQYELAVTTGVKDKAGTALQDARTFRFQTAP
ncbi:MAG: hypothetical protein GX591_03615 [Planctomycetes bacterium]|nr:hypothetical protein [Planctomycetota bacterium]